MSVLSPPEVWTVKSMLEWATSFFASRQVKSPRLSIEWLLSEVLQLKRLDLYLQFDRPLSKQELETLRSLVKRRANHEPLQYIIGKVEFLNTELKITPVALIPRPETEFMVSEVLDRLSSYETLRILDIGTGSGCIPIALKHARPTDTVVTFDISEPALALAQENAAQNQTEIEFLQRNIFSERWFTPSTPLFDVLISNPPYVKESERSSLDREVVAFEPGLALFQENPLGIYDAIRHQAEHLLSKERTSPSLLVLEIHEELSEGITSLFSPKKWSVSLVHDLDGKPRNLFCTLIK